MSYLPTQIIIIYRVAMDFSCGKKIISLLKLYNLKNYMTSNSNTAMSLSPWIISGGVLYTFWFFPQKLNIYFHLLFPKYIQSMVANSFCDVTCYKNLLHLKEQGVFIYPELWSVVCQFNLVLSWSMFDHAR